MSRWIKTGLGVLLLLALIPVTPAQAQTNADCIFYGEHSNGAKYCITMPPPPPYGIWNGDLVIFAHGYVAVNEPLDIPWSQMTFSDGMGGVITMPFLLNSMGYAFATTSYSENGLAVQQGIADVLDLIDVFTSLVGTPTTFILLAHQREAWSRPLRLNVIPGHSLEDLPRVVRSGASPGRSITGAISGLYLTISWTHLTLMSYRGMQLIFPGH
jgi:hypothetical protein